MAADPKIDARPRKWLTPVVLVILTEGSSYGYELMERITEFGFEEINAGTLYRTLRRMEAEGLCQSEWEPADSGPARRTYSITEAGVSYLEAWANACKKYQEVLEAFTKAYASNSSLRPSSEQEESSST